MRMRILVAQHYPGTKPLASYTFEHYTSANRSRKHHRRTGNYFPIQTCTFIHVHYTAIAKLYTHYVVHYYYYTKVELSISLLLIPRRSQRNHVRAPRRVVHHDVPQPSGGRSRSLSTGN